MTSRRFCFCRLGLGVAVQAADGVAPDARVNPDRNRIQVETVDLEFASQARGRENRPVAQKRLIGAVKHIRKQLRPHAGRLKVVDGKLRATTNRHSTNGEPQVGPRRAGIDAEEVNRLRLEVGANRGQHGHNPSSAGNNVNTTGHLLPATVRGQAIAARVGLNPTLSGVELLALRAHGHVPGIPGRTTTTTGRRVNERLADRADKLSRSLSETISARHDYYFSLVFA